MNHEVIHISKREVKELKPSIKEIESLIDIKLTQALDDKCYINASIFREIKSFISSKLENIKTF